eukprot:9487589-Pyramimonas_sp.AAC.1
MGKPKGGKGDPKRGGPEGTAKGQPKANADAGKDGRSRTSNSAPSSARRGAAAGAINLRAWHRPKLAPSGGRSFNCGPLSTILL